MPATYHTPAEYLAKHKEGLLLRVLMAAALSANNDRPDLRSTANVVEELARRLDKRT